MITESRMRRCTDARRALSMIGPSNGRPPMAFRSPDCRTARRSTVVTALPVEYRASVWYACYVTEPALRALLLDYGGTLDGDARHWFDHFLELYARCGVTLTPATLKPAFYAADEALAAEPDVRRFGLERMTEAHVRLQLAALGTNDGALARRLVDAFVADTRSAWDRNRPVLQRLARAFRLGVVSNSSGNMPALLAEAGLAPFEVIIDSALVGVRKPDPGIYALAARRLDLPPSAILHTGDSWERDVAPARAAGMRAAWLAAPEMAAPAVLDGVARIASLGELESLVA